jgi:hypothetical protein
MRRSQREIVEREFESFGRASKKEKDAESSLNSQFLKLFESLVVEALKTV